MGYRNKSIKGFAWLGTNRIIIRGISLLRIAILARILSPLQFGIFGIASIMLDVLEIFTETGINIILIQNKENSDKYISTAWIVSIFRGFIIFSVIFLLAPFISVFFNAPSALNIVRLISFVPLLRGFINPSVAKFSKDLHFHKEFYYRSSVFLVEAIISIFLVIIYKSPVGMVWGLIAAAFFEIFFSFIFASPRPKLEFDKSIFKNVVGRGKWITLGGIFNYLYQNLDNMTVAKILGPASLGFYDMAYRISLLPITEVADVIGKITLPVYVKISEDKERLRKAFFKSLAVISILIFPLGLVLLLFPNSIISIALGNKWLPAAPVLQLLAIFGILQALLYPMMTLLLSVHKQRICTFINFVNFIGLVVTIIPLTLAYGITGAAFSSIIGALVTFPGAIYFTRKELVKNK